MLGIYLEYLGDMLGISLGYLGDILGISRGYLGDIFGISWGYLGDILGISLSERTSGVPPVIFQTDIIAPLLALTHLIKLVRE